MKESKYNFFFDYSDDSSELIAYNSRTNALALIEKENYDKYKKYIEESIPIDDEKLIEELKRGGFLIDDNINELEILKYNLLANRYSSKHLSLTIAPTLDCNFACIYCYEKGKRKALYMSQEVQNALINYVEHQSKNISNLTIAWYGGEPLLALDVIDNITKKVLQICEKQDINYSSVIVTNGYNLTREVAKKIKEFRVESIQVTIDGPENIHNSRRPLKNGEPTFLTIIKNLSENIDVLPPVSLRINIDKENLEKIEEIFNILKDYKLEQKVYPYPGYVEPTNDCYSLNRCLTISDFSNFEYEFQMKAVNKGFKNNFLDRYPIIKTNFCGADSINSVVIDPKGDLYKCWSDIGRDEYKIGNIINNELLNIDVYFNYMLYDVTQDSKCINCNVLPLCMGGCPRRRIDKTVDRCGIYKYVLDKYIKTISFKMIENLKNKKKVQNI